MLHIKKCVHLALLNTGFSTSMNRPSRTLGKFHDDTIGDVSAALRSVHSARIPDSDLASVLCMSCGVLENDVLLSNDFITERSFSVVVCVQFVWMAFSGGLFKFFLLRLRSPTFCVLGAQQPRR